MRYLCPFRREPGERCRLHDVPSLVGAGPTRSRHDRIESMGGLMAHGRVNAAKFISRCLSEPHETELGEETAHRLLATAYADRCCPRSGHGIPWLDCYVSADQLPLTLKADLLLEPDGEPSPIPRHLAGEERARAVEAGRLAAWIRREAHRRGIR